MDAVYGVHCLVLYCYICCGGLLSSGFCLVLVGLLGCGCLWVVLVVGRYFVALFVVMLLWFCCCGVHCLLFSCGVVLVLVAYGGFTIGWFGLGFGFLFVVLWCGFLLLVGLCCLAFVVICFAC